MSGTKRTCYLPHEIDDALKKARRKMSWRTWKKHNYGYRVTHREATGLEAMYITDGLIDCERCGQDVREQAIAKAGKGFSDRSSIYLTLVLPTENARAAVSKQIRGKNGIGWYISIFRATVLVSDTAILSKAGGSYSVEVTETDLEQYFKSLVDMWWPDSGRMSWINWPPVATSEKSQSPTPETDRREFIDNTNTSLPRNLDKLHVDYVDTGSGRWLDIDADKSSPAALEAIRRSKSRPNKTDINVDTDGFDAQETSREDTG